ncbi:3-hydroxyisobutyrate dehydrogenase [Raineyella antarctica]|uniref:3-hydroxyisobutyrate dehydrogenase n=1 Tax=Raineyella antarctica TaxID=1577474 RepID=A0A1G6GJ66_9ACTN|nr:NAD(P)-dependent oxidoreductase [Raineyella antarctica]SDB81226.1 3-hydroxyisobutyrate dehydrogenase [Raineyella antarctica]
MSAYGKVVILGTGIMGRALTERLLGQGVDVTVWNRTASRAEPLAELGATVAATPAEAVAGADTVLLTLFDAAAVVEVLTEAADAAPGAVWVQMSTIGTDGTEEVASVAASHGLDLVEAMMLGTKGPAETGKLVLLTAGNADLLAKVEPLLALVSQKRVHAGPALGDGTRLKLVCNTWIGLLTAGTGQAFAMMRALGLDEKLFLEAISGGQSDSVYAHAKGALMLADDYQPANFQLRGLRKDLDLAADATGGDGTFGVLDAVRGLYAAAEDAGNGAEDIAAVFRVFEGDAYRGM